MSHHKVKYVRTQEASAAVLLEYLISVGAEQTAELLDALISAGTDDDDTTAFESLQGRLSTEGDGSSLQLMVRRAWHHKKDAGRRTLEVTQGPEGSGSAMGVSSSARNYTSSANHTERSSVSDDGQRISATFPAITSPPAALDSVPHTMDHEENYFSVDRQHTGVQHEGLSDSGPDAAYAPQAGTWSKAEVALLRASLKRHPAALYGKNERFAAIASDVGRPKKECFAKFRELLQVKRERAAASRSPASQSSTPSSSSPASEIEASDYEVHVDTSKLQSPACPEVAAPVQPPHNAVWAALSAIVAEPALPARSTTVMEAVSLVGSAGEVQLEDADFTDADASHHESFQAVSASAPSNQRTDSVHDVLAIGSGSRPEDVITHTAMKLNTGAIASAAFRARELELKPVKISIEVAATLRALLYGAPAPAAKKHVVRAFNEEWLQQGLFFSQQDGLKYGLIQAKGGPCGAVAVVQAEFLRHLFYSDPSLFDASITCDALQDYTQEWTPVEFESCALDPNELQQQRALVLAITDIIWRCRASNSASACFAIVEESLAVPSARHAASRTAPKIVTVHDTVVTYTGDGLTEYLKLISCSTKFALAAAVESQLPLLARVDGPAIPLIVYSCLLTRGLETVLSDMDVGMGSQATLVGAHNYATQELVNLLLTGRATTNVFDGVHQLTEADTTLELRGVLSRSLVGFLTLFESYGYLKVGKNYKQPVTPIWVVCAESHYSVAFAAPRGVVYPEAALEKVGKLARRGTRISAPIAEAALGLEAATLESGAFPRLFDMLYFDSLGRQDTLVRLSVTVPDESTEIDNALSHQKNLRSTSDEPPLELVFHTRWPGAKVNWNGTEPLL